MNADRGGARAALAMPYDQEFRCHSGAPHTIYGLGDR
jgi:hypothetical protein